MVTATESVHIGAELPERISTLLLDLDGTLVDTTYFHTVAWFLACDELGEHRPMAAIHPLIGMGGPELMHELLGRSSESLSAAHDRIFSEYLASVRPLPGAPELVAFGATRGLHVCVVTSSGDDVVDSLMAPLGGVGAVDDVVHAGMAERTKPHPDLFQVALERVRVPPSEALAVGDAVWDVRSAASAGVACVGLESGGTARAALIHAGAVDVYRDARQMLHEWRGNPGEAPGTGE
jgi:beta-phosphoglucomutase-like phosphatase (HAD superfamily)